MVGPCYLEDPSLYCYSVLLRLVVALVLDIFFRSWTLGLQIKVAHWDQVVELLLGVHLDVLGVHLEVLEVHLDLM